MKTTSLYRLALVVLIAVFYCSMLGAWPTRTVPKPSDPYKWFEDGPYSLWTTRRVGSYPTTSFSMPRLTNLDNPGLSRKHLGIDCPFYGPNIGGYQMLNSGGTRIMPGSSLSIHCTGENSYTGKAWMRCWYGVWYPSTYLVVLRSHTERRTGSYSVYTGRDADGNATYSTRYYTYYVTIIDNAYYQQYWTWYRQSRVPYKDYTKLYKYHQSIWEYGYRWVREAISSWPYYRYVWKEVLTRAHGSPMHLVENFGTILGLRDIYQTYKFKMLAWSIYFRGLSKYLPLQYFSTSTGVKVHPRPPVSLSPFRVSRPSGWVFTTDPNRVQLRFNWVKDSRNGGQEIYYIEYLKYFNGYISMKDVLALLRNLAPGQNNIPIYMKIEKEPMLYYVDTVIPSYISKTKPSVKAIIKDKNKVRKYYFHLGFDMNLDGKVDDADKKLAEQVLVAGDLNGDKKVNQADIDLWPKYNEKLNVAAASLVNGVCAVKSPRRKVLTVGPYDVDGNLKLSATAAPTYWTFNAKTSRSSNFPSVNYSFRFNYSLALSRGLAALIIDWILMPNTIRAYKKGDATLNGYLDSGDVELLRTAVLMCDVTGDRAFTSADLAKFNEFKKDAGVIITDLSNRKIAINYTAKFRVKTGAVVSAKSPRGASSLIVKETFAYTFHEPRIWAVDSAEGNQLSPSKVFPIYSSEPTESPVPPYPDVQIINKP